MAVLLLTGMISIDLVTMMTARRDLIRAEISKADLLLSSVAQYLMANPLQGEAGGGIDSRAGIDTLVSAGNSDTLLVLDQEKRHYVFGKNAQVPLRELLGSARKAVRTGKTEIRYIGVTRGLFWDRKSHMVVSASARSGNRALAGLAVLWPLEGVYASIRNSQKFLIFYVIINATILTFLGIYRVFKLYLQPLSRLARRAEEYREDDDILFSVRKQDNELNRLSTALNGMLRRMSADREKLRSTVASLERANKELKCAQQEIIRAEKLASVGRLSAGIAHEIGNPIGIVMGYLDLLKQQGTTAAEHREYIQRTEKEISRIHQIIRQLLEISRPSRKGLEQVSVHELLTDIVEVFKLQPLTANISFDCDFRAASDRVTADSNQLRQVFLNLIINAADAIASRGNGTRGTVRICTDSSPAAGAPTPPESPTIFIRFSDNGPGIPKENIDNIFDPFFTTKEPGKGTGLGLSVSYMIIERFGGEITVHSQPGEGTDLAIQLPLRRPATGGGAAVN